MRYLVLATDFDGTLAEDGVVPPETISALENCRASGRHLLMVTGRELTELKVVFPHLHLFDFVVVENGATLYNPQTDEEQALTDPPSPEFVRALQSRHVSPLSVGKVIVATCTPHENDVLEVIRDLGLEMQVIFNKGAVMVLPSGVNKATGLKAALSLLKISPHNVVSVGDGENDHALLTFSELGVAVSNAVPMLAERADWVTKGARGYGVVELVDSLIKTDFRGLESRLRRHDIPFAHSAGQVAINIPPYETKMEMLGVQNLNDWWEVAEFGGRIAAQGYQLCVILPDVEHAELFKTLIPNSSVITGKVSDGVSILKDIKSHLIFDVAQLSARNPTTSIPELLQGMTNLRSRLGRPHWILVCEPERILHSPADWKTLLEQHSSILLASSLLPSQIPDEIRQATQFCVCFNPDVSRDFQQITKLRTVDQSLSQPTQDQSVSRRAFWSRGTNDLVSIELIRKDNPGTDAVTEIASRTGATPDPARTG
ncbi:MAG: HAD family hydrolase [Planctomycetales bacterium]